MAAFALDAAELQRLLRALFFERSVALADKALQGCHVYRPGYLRPGEADLLGPEERYFRHDLAYRAFSLHVQRVHMSADKFVAVRVQFKRPSRRSLLPVGWWSPSRGLVGELRALFRTALAERGSEKTDDGTRIFWYGEPLSPPRAPTLSAQADSMGYEGRPMEWECAIADEPHSSGLVEPDETKKRNDFVCLQLLSSQP